MLLKTIRNVLAVQINKAKFESEMPKYSWSNCHLIRADYLALCNAKLSSFLAYLTIF